MTRRATAQNNGSPSRSPSATKARVGEARTHFLTVTYWESEESIRVFAGDDLLKAKYYPEDQDYLLGFEPLVQHFFVAAIEKVVQGVAADQQQLGSID